LRVPYWKSSARIPPIDNILEVQPIILVVRYTYFERGGGSQGFIELKPYYKRQKHEGHHHESDPRGDTEVTEVTPSRRCHGGDTEVTLSCI